MAAIERKFTLHVPSSTENLALIREFVTSVGRQAKLDEAEVHNLELAVDEACANVIEHAYGHDHDKEVVVRAVFDEEELGIEVTDTGRGFDPAIDPPGRARQTDRPAQDGRPRAAPHQNPHGRGQLRDRPGPEEPAPDDQENPEAVATFRRQRL